MREIHRLIDGADHRYGDIAVFYRTNAQSRVLEESFVRSGVPYRVFGGVKFYDRREIKDALAYLRALVNPDDEVSWKRIVNTPRRGVGDTSIAKIDSYASGAGIPFPAAIAKAADAGVNGKALGGLRDLLELMDEAREAAKGGVAAALEAVLTQSGYLAELESERSIEAQGRIENLQELVGSTRDFDEQVDRGDFSGLVAIGGVGVGANADEPAVAPRRARTRAGVPRGDLARHRPRRERSRGELGHADDAALGEGSRVPGRVPDRPRRRRVPARAQPRRSRRARRGTPALLRRHHPRRAAPLPVPRVEPHDVRLHRLPPAEPVPRRDPGRADHGDRRRRAARQGSRPPPRLRGRRRDAPPDRAGRANARRRAPRRSARTAPSRSGCASATT